MEFIIFYEILLFSERFRVFYNFSGFYIFDVPLKGIFLCIADFLCKII